MILHIENSETLKGVRSMLKENDRIMIENDNAFIAFEN